MSRTLMILMTMSLGVTGCQKAKLSGKKQAPATVANAPAPQPAPFTPPPRFPPPPPPVLTDETGGQIHQPHRPIVVIPPPVVQQPPPTQQPTPFPTPIPQPFPQPPPVVQQPPPLPQPPPVIQQPLPEPIPFPQPPPVVQQPPVVPQPPPPISWPTPPPVPQQPAPNPIATPTPAPIQPPPVAPPPPPGTGIDWTAPPAPPQQPPVVQRPPGPPAPPEQPPTIVEWDKPAPLPPQPQPCNDPKGCGTQVVQPEPPPPPEDCTTIADCVPPQDPTKAKCTAPLRVDKSVIRSKVDILFVVDTSASLTRGGVRTRNDGELRQIGRGMKEFVKSLDADTDYRIGVLTGHGPASRYHGKLITSGEGDPAVIDNKSLRREGMSHAQISAELGRVLERKMMAVPNESGGAQGEAMLLALYNVVTKANLRSAIERQGLFRKDASLNIIVVTDEQDVCFDYTGTNYTPVLVADKNNPRGPKVVDPIEVAFFEKTCKKAGPSGQPLTVAHVTDALQALKGNVDSGKILMNGILYTTPVPASLQGIVEDENEMGHGILELVANFKGQYADLAKVYLTRSQFAPELKHFGSNLQFNLNIKNTFVCRSNVHPDAINATSMQLKVLDKRGQHIATFFGGCNAQGCPEGVAGPLRMAVHVDTRGRHTPYTVVDVDKETLKAVLTSHNVEDGSVEMEFWTSSDRNPETGLVWDRRQMKPRPARPAPAAPAATPAREPSNPLLAPDGMEDR